jgi:hypothetical protein
MKQGTSFRKDFASCSDKNPNTKSHIFIEFIGNSAEEEYTAISVGGNVHLKAQNSAVATTGWSNLEIGIESGHLPEFLGKNQPRFPLRPLWIQCEIQLLVSLNLSIFIPLFFCSPHTSSKIDLFCKRVLELGYNAVIFGNQRQGVNLIEKIENFDLNKIISAFHSFGIQVIIKPFLEKDIIQSPAHSNYENLLHSEIHTLLKIASGIDFIFWESFLLHPDFSKSPITNRLTIAELVVKEVQVIEKNLKDRCALIFYVPANDLQTATEHSKWFSKFLDDVGSHTIIAFSALAGDPRMDHLPPHPIWHSLRISPDFSLTPLLPIVNFGGVQQGEGLWPSIPLDLIDSYVNRCYRHPFAGIITLTSHLPKKGGFLDCGLWVASQSMWRNLSPSLLAETWFRANYSNIDFFKLENSLKVNREIVVELSRVRSLTNEKGRDSVSQEECRMIAESLLAKIKLLNENFEKSHKTIIKNPKKPTCLDYFTLFIRDARRIILHFLQCYNVPMGNVLNGTDMQDSFWTQINQGTGQGIRSGNKVTFLDVPMRGIQGSKMEQIYLENRLFEE